MDYSKLSDTEINEIVSGAMGIPPGDDWCNDPASAWLIITDNKIDITFDTDPDIEWAPCRAQGPRGHDCYAPVDKALRAAMIVYLMMQEQKA
ncbi:DUF2591 family protein [Serratia sp. JSRIV002]|nr:DUF2591 family protein [Serratia sp. JSRIV002]